MSAKKRTLQKTKKLFFYAGFALILLIGAFSIWAMTLNIPDFEAFKERKIIESTKIYDRSGQTLLYDIHDNIRRTVVPFSEIPRHVKNATVAIEDSNFYNHRGVDFLSIVRAFLINIFYGQIRQGGSTITQQLVKNTLLTSTQTIERKLKEMVLAFKVEHKFSKE